MLMMLILCVMLCSMISPLKTSIMVVLVSLLMSMNMYSGVSFMFPPTVMVISFSSGMMIVFCYCSMMSNYESKLMKKKIMMTVTVIGILSSFKETKSLSFSKTKNIGELINSPFIIMGMMFIMISMIAINKSIFNPTKPLSQSY